MIRRRRVAGGPAAAPPPGARILRLYPASWRRRYAAEMLATLEQARIGWRGRLDLARGALDARLHGPTRVPAGAALVSGGLWTVAGAGIVAQPVPPEWPGYLLEALPLATIAAALAGVATIGCWARRSDDGGRASTVAITLATLGHLVWVAALAGAWLHGAIGSGTIAAQTVGALGAVLVGLVLVRWGDDRVGAVLVLAPTLLVVGGPFAWLGVGFGWTLVGVLLLTGADPAEKLPTRFA